jgi:hypothetical protein
MTSFDFNLNINMALAEAKGFFSSLCVHTNSGAHQPPVQWAPGVLSPGQRAAGA